MSTYIQRYCIRHGDWDMDVDNVGECPKCEEGGLTEVQQLKREKADLESKACGMKEACAKIADQHPDTLESVGEAGSGKFRATSQVATLIRALSSTPECKHKEEVVTLTGQLNAANQRAQLVLAAKNCWVDRAKIAEQQLASLQAELIEVKRFAFDDNTVRGLKAELKEAKEKLELGNNVADFLDTLYKQAPTLREEGLENFDGYFCCLSEIQKACQSAWSSPRGFAESPTELIYQIIEERDRLQDALDEERGKVMEVYFYKLHNTNLSHCDYCLSSDKRHSWTRQQWTEEGRKQRK